MDPKRAAAVMLQLLHDGNNKLASVAIYVDAVRTGDEALSALDEARVSLTEAVAIYRQVASICKALGPS